jgi:hypothetical protein
MQVPGHDASHPCIRIGTDRCQRHTTRPTESCWEQRWNLSPNGDSRLLRCSHLLQHVCSSKGQTSNISATDINGKASTADLTDCDMIFLLKTDQMDYRCTLLVVEAVQPLHQPWSCTHTQTCTPMDCRAHRSRNKPTQTIMVLCASCNHSGASDLLL